MNKIKGEKREKGLESITPGRKEEKDGNLLGNRGR